MRSKSMLIIILIACMATAIAAVASAEQKKAAMSGPYLPPQKVEAMMKMMMTMPPDNLEASMERGKKIFNDNSLGNNKTGLSCNSCHPNGGTVGGTAQMEWKGTTMNPKTPTLQGAAAHFPAPRGPMSAVVTLKGMNNMCIMTFQKGMPLDENSQESTDLSAYVTSLSKGAPLSPGQPPTVP